MTREAKIVVSALVSMLLLIGGGAGAITQNRLDNKHFQRRLADAFDTECKLRTENVDLRMKLAGAQIEAERWRKAALPRSLTGWAFIAKRGECLPTVSAKGLMDTHLRAISQELLQAGARQVKQDDLTAVQGAPYLALTVTAREHDKGWDVDAKLALISEHEELLVVSTSLEDRDPFDYSYGARLIDALLNQEPKATP